MQDQAEQLRQMMRGRGGENNGAAPVRNRTRIIAVSSGKGGVGKTNISTALAIAYAKIGKKVILLDADLGLANVNVVMGIIPKYNLYHLMERQRSIKEIILDTEYGVKIVAGASGFSKIANLGEEEREYFIEEMSQLSNADIVIVDTGAGVSDNVISFISAADDAVIVTTPEPTAITDAYSIIKIIAGEVDNSRLSIKLLVNRVQSVKQGKDVAGKIIGIAGQFLNLKVDYLGYVMEDPAVLNAVLRQRPFFDLSPSCKASECIRHIVGRLENIEYKEGSGVTSFLKRMFAKNG